MSVKFLEGKGSRTNFQRPKWNKAPGPVKAKIQEAIEHLFIADMPVPQRRLIVDTLNSSGLVEVANPKGGTNVVIQVVHEKTTYEVQVCIDSLASLCGFVHPDQLPWTFQSAL